MNTRLSRTLLLLSPIPALLLNLLFFTPALKSHAAQVPEKITTSNSNGPLTQDEVENITIYQQVAPAVVSINSGQDEGAGVILTPDGLVVTNRHVINNARTVSVKTTNGHQYQAQLISTKGFNKDLAFLKIQSNDTFPTVRLGDSTSVRVGQRVLAIGSPFGLDGTLTTGIISRIDYARNMLQTDAAINPGNSGGPLLNGQGDLIGINRSIINPVGASSAGISFAVPINVVKQEIASLGINATIAATHSENH